MKNDYKVTTIIDLTGVTNNRDLHLLFKEKLVFPDFYGENWDAFWDAITGLIEMPSELVFQGWSNFNKNLPSDAAMLKEILDEYNKEVAFQKCEIYFR
ncbi:barstar family protein [Bacillus pseudomycoides]|uniref:barstar family protein n=1 Tax=Bacillus pseudomycoides TaxID=64104 RepID=UPI000BECC76E|nr:barstar family protein [Bacillus pseudomycoides]PEB39402.1 barnase inhibitor [Bacillus pseudomycoides]PGD89835.1 barnase inhibitor [Bacillus pseudomycoides]PHE60291.1 barnase inhibitor [Bacillus pseudomycoides]PHG09790.1 barnase inhibitor [Bacillus pseudomycoides]